MLLRSPCIVCSFVTSNIVCMLNSILAIVLGLWALKNVLDYHTSVPVFVFIFLPALFVVAGVATIVCGIIGFVALRYGSFSEGRRIFGTYILALTIVLLTELAVTISSIDTPRLYPDSIQNSANNTFSFYLSNEHIQESWNNAQKTLQCCGVSGYMDYQEIFNNFSVPVSCCNTTSPLANETTCPEIVMDVNDFENEIAIFSEGCVSQFELHYQSKFLILFAVGLPTAMLLTIPLGLIGGLLLISSEKPFKPESWL